MSSPPSVSDNPKLSTGPPSPASSFASARYATSAAAGGLSGHHDNDDAGRAYKNNFDTGLGSAAYDDYRLAGMMPLYVTHQQPSIPTYQQLQKLQQQQANTLVTTTERYNSQGWSLHYSM